MLTSQCEKEIKEILDAHGGLIAPLVNKLFDEINRLRMLRDLTTPQWIELDTYEQPLHEWTQMLREDAENA